MEQVAMEVEKANKPSLEIRLNAISLKMALRVASQKFKTQDPLENISVARFLWHVASTEIPRIHGEAGKRAVHLMEIMAYFGDDQDECVTKRTVPHREESLSIARAWGLLSTSDNFECNAGCRHGIIYFHSQALMEAIAKETADRELAFLKDCIDSRFEFSTRNYYSIWSKALKYDDKDLFSKFEQSHLNTDGIEEELNEEEQNLFVKIILKHEELFGKYDERTMTLKFWNVKQMLDVSLEVRPLKEAWKIWDDYKSSFDEFFRIHKDDIDFCGDWVDAMFSVLEEFLGFVEEPPPRRKYEKKFLNEGVIMAKKLFQPSMCNPGWVGNIVSKLLLYTEELGNTKNVPRLMSQWLNIVTVAYNIDPEITIWDDWDEYGADSAEWEAISTSLRMATTPGITSILRRSILENVLPIIEFYDRDIQYAASDCVYRSTAEGKMGLTMCKLILFRVQCLEGLKKYDEVFQTVEKTKKFRNKMAFSADEIGEETVTNYNDEIDKILLRCPRQEA